MKLTWNKHFLGSLWEVVTFFFHNVFRVLLLLGDKFVLFYFTMRVVAKFKQQCSHWHEGWCYIRHIKCSTTIHSIRLVHFISSIMSTNTHRYIIATKHNLYLPEQSFLPKNYTLTHTFIYQHTQLHNFLLLTTYNM